MADPATPATPAPAATERKIAPIPPGKEGKASGVSAPATPPARNPDGTFASTGEREDDGGLPDILKDDSGVEDDYDRAKATLDGGEPQKIKPLAHTTKKTRARDVLKAPAPEGADATTPAPLDGDGVAPLPEGAQPPAEGGPEGDPVADPDEPPLEIKGKLIIAGTEYRDVAHLEQSVKSLRGMYVSEVKARTQAKDVAMQNYHASTAWQGRANAAEAELARLKGTAPPTDAGGAPSPGSTPSTAPGAVATKVAAATGDTAENILKSIDWDRYKKIRETHDAETALVWVMEQSLTKIQQRYDARLEEMTKPAKEQSALMEQGSAIGDQMDAMREWKYEDSADAIYPELADSDAYEEIAQVVVAMHGKGLPLEFFKTPEGINQAVLTWRDWRARNKRPWSPAGATSITPTAPDAHEAAAASVRAAAGGPGAVVTRSAPLRPAAGDSGRGSEIVRGIVETGKPTEFGWAR